MTPIETAPELRIARPMHPAEPSDDVSAEPSLGPLPIRIRPGTNYGIA
jgi:hypothetical protein